MTRKTFGIYIFQFTKNLNNQQVKIKAYNTTMIGEVCMSSAEYVGMSIEEACKKRVYKEICGKLGLGIDEKYITFIDFIEIKDYIDAGVDKKLHKILRENGCKQVKCKDDFTEMFELGSNPMVAIEAAVKKYCGSYSREIFIPRAIQKKCIKQITTYFNNKIGNDFLIFAVCRFGKTSTTLYSVIHELQKKNILILSSKCDVQTSWQKDFMKWDFTQDYNFITKEGIKKNPDILMKNKKVCFMSFQTSADVDKEMTAEERKWCEILNNYKWDVIIIDECHYGSHTERSQKLINQLFTKKTIKIELSATPYKLINEGKYTLENSFVYTLIDEDKTTECYVPVKFYHLNMQNFTYSSNLMTASPNAITFQKMVDFYKEPNFSWDGLFNKFTDNDIGFIVKSLYEKVMIKNGSRHIAIVVSKIEYGNKLYEGLKNYLDLDVVNLCGKNKIELYEINNKLNDNIKPVILISCNRYMTGTTMEKLDTVVFMRTVHSAETYVQYMLRAKNYFDGRNTACMVYDLSPEAYIKSDAFTNLVLSESKMRKKNVHNIVEAYGNCLSLFEINNFDCISEVSNFADEFEKDLYTMSSNSQCPRVDIYLDNLFNNISNNFLKFLKEKDENKVVITHINDIHKLKKEKNTKKVKNKNEKKLNIVELKSKLSKILAKLPTFMRFNNIDDINCLFIDNKQNNQLCEDLEYWTNGFTFEFLNDIKESMDQYYWNEFCKALSTVSKNLPIDREKWDPDFDAPRPVNNWRV